MNDDVVGYVFAIPFLMYTLGVPIVTKINDRMDRRLMIAIAFGATSVALFLTGPS